jgi:hypothetical protein
VFVTGFLNLCESVHGTHYREGWFWSNAYDLAINNPDTADNETLDLQHPVTLLHMDKSTIKLLTYHKHNMKLYFINKIRII